ncbi:MAG: hypothetical protein ACP5H8_01835 [Candidatus Micrarchaeia archaeon]
MGIGSMRYKDLLKKVPEDIDVEIESKCGESIIHIKKKVSKKSTEIDILPSMF